MYNLSIQYNLLEIQMKGYTIWHLQIVHPEFINVHDAEMKRHMLKVKNSHHAQHAVAIAVGN